MAQVTRAASKLKFETGDVPTQADFSDLHDSVKWYDEGGAASDVLSTYSLLGGATKAEPLWSSFNISGGTGFNSGQIRFVAVYLPIAATITGARWFQATTGAYTANNYNGVGLYSYSGGTLTLVASSTNDGTIWTGLVNSWQQKAFTTPYSAAAGVYFVAALYCQSAQTTAPAIGFATAPLNSSLLTNDFTNSSTLVGVVSGATSLPSTQASSGIIPVGSLPYLAIY